jgi:aspartyl-tRNA(Asn)/glutamyl-tRNA(Gln) amidotransferase subunit A
VSSEGIWTWCACDLADAIRAGRLKAAEVLEVFLDRIDRFDHEIRAFVQVDVEGSREQAERIDRLVGGGEDPGPLAGVPVAVKDLEDARGLPTRRGSLISDSRPATEDSIQVHRFRTAGAVILGKTATPEFGSLAYTWSRAFGTTRNPWNLDRTPGGSSGGSAAAVTAGLAPLATGSDGGGSIRIPASYCGLPGLKPTAGLVPAAIGRQVKRLSSHGLLARSVRDIARALDQVVGPDPRDPLSIPKPAVSLEDSLEEECARLASLRPALKAVWSKDLGFGWCQPQVAAIVRGAAERLFDAAGIVEEEISLELPDPGPAWLVFWALNYYAELGEVRPDRRPDLTTVVSAVLQFAEEIGVAEVAEASRRGFEVFERINAILDEVDVIVTPTMPSPAFPAKGPLPGPIAQPGPDPSGRSRLPEMVMRSSASGIDPISGVCFTFPFNLTGHPAISVPAGLDERGVPVGMQIVGPRFSDLRLLALAQMMERAWAHPRMPARYQ